MIAVIGASGQLGSAFVRLLGDEALPVTRNDFDVTSEEDVTRWIDTASPDLVINCAAFTAVDAAETEPDEARKLNVDAAASLGRATATRGIGYVLFSTDYVFDGSKGTPYIESDEPNPLNVYGMTKLAGERAALESHARSLVVRTSWLMSGTHQNFARSILDLLQAGPVSVVEDQFGRPTFVDDLAPAVMEAIAAGIAGVLHLTNQGAASWWELATEIASIARLDPSLVRPISTDESERPARRAPDSRMDSERSGPAGLAPLPHYRPSLERAVAELLEPGPLQ